MASVLVEFFDDLEFVGLIECDEWDVDRIKELLEEYKGNCEDAVYNNFLEYIRNNGIEFKEVRTDGDIRLYF